MSSNHVGYSHVPYFLSQIYHLENFFGHEEAQKNFLIQKEVEKSLQILSKNQAMWFSSYIDGAYYIHIFNSC